jgi:hypothetical protein
MAEPKEQESTTATVSERLSTQPERSRPSAQRRSVNRAINGLIRWMPMGGSGFAFLSFLLRQEWVTSLILFPVMAISAVWAAYRTHLTSFRSLN